ncbi:MAG: type IV pilin, partial [Methanoregula sp.]|nr:type IV pilin [Methanoregula sp.]
MIVRKNKSFTEDAVSPVVGVMLMLVVVIIIAAVVSGFAGSLVSGEKKAPQMSAETTIAN